MAHEPLSCVELEPRDGPAERAILWLHGLGADGNDFVPIVPELGLDPALRVRFVFPHAPAIPVTINMGMVMRAWYDITDLDLGRRHDADGVRRSASAVAQLIAREEARGIPAERIVLAGFSQGGAIALHEGLRHPKRLAGIVALSTYLVLEATLGEEASPANAALPIFQAHGTHDPMVPVAAGERARDRLVASGHDVEWHAYPMEHQVCGPEISDLGAWLGERFPVD